jgi:hypothetical protein
MPTDTPAEFIPVLVRWNKPEPLLVKPGANRFLGTLHDDGTVSILRVVEPDEEPKVLQQIVGYEARRLGIVQARAATATQRTAPVQGGLYGGKTPRR